MASDDILQIKITLNDSKPRVWRRILVPDDYTFFDLHCAIQSATGWMDSHLHAFRFTNKKDNWHAINIATPTPDDEDAYRDKIIDERLTPITDYLGRVSKQCVYDYDFGDSWAHTVVLEKSLPRERGKTYPQCVAGANSCPPDDCGGVWGYAHLLEVLKDPRHEEYADMLEWLCIENGDEFDPSEFNPAEVQFEDPKERLVEWNKGFGKPAIPGNDMVEIKTPEDGLFESSTFVGSPAGSKNGKLRYFVILSWEGHGKLTDRLKKRVHNATESVAREEVAEIEKLEYADEYALLTILISFDKAIGDVIDDITITANGTDPFLRFHYYVTNTAKPTKSDIKKYLKEFQDPGQSNKSSAL